MNKKNYQRILNTIIKKAPIETGVQTLVYMLLDEIVSNKYKQKVSVLVADLRKGKEPIFGGDGGIVDLCVVKEEFNYIEQNSDDIEEMKKNRVGCVEIKATTHSLSKYDKIDQIIGHIRTYKKVIYTNGLVWQYYAPTNEELEKINKEYVEYKKYREECSKAKKRLKEKLKEKCTISKNSQITPKMVEKYIKELNEYYEKIKTNPNEEDRQKLLNKGLKELEELKKLKKTLEQLEDLRNIMKKWLETKENRKWEIKIAKNSKITRTTKKIDCVEIDEQEFNKLIGSLNAIEWEKDNSNATIQNS